MPSTTSTSSSIFHFRFIRKRLLTTSCVTHLIVSKKKKNTKYEKYTQYTYIRDMLYAEVNAKTLYEKMVFSENERANGSLRKCFGENVYMLSDWNTRMRYNIFPSLYIKFV